MPAMVAKVQRGRLVVDEATDLPEGTVVQLYVVDHGDGLDDVERAELDDALDAAAAEVARGDTISAEHVLRALDDQE